MKDKYEPFDSIPADESFMNLSIEWSLLFTIATEDRLIDTTGETMPTLDELRELAKTVPNLNSRINDIKNSWNQK